MTVVAQALRYDLVYLLRLRSSIRQPCPLLPHARERDSLEISTKLLLAHGLPHPPPIFDAGLHLRALRSVGGLIYQNPAESGDVDDQVGFKLGILLPLVKDEEVVRHIEDGVDEDVDEGYGSYAPPEICRGGIVLAAFTRRKRGSEAPFAADEVRFLREFGDALRGILVIASAEK